MRELVLGPSPRDYFHCLFSETPHLQTFCRKISFLCSSVFIIHLHHFSCISLSFLSSSYFLTFCVYCSLCIWFLLILLPVGKGKGIIRRMVAVMFLKLQKSGSTWPGFPWVQKREFFPYGPFRIKEKTKGKISSM